MQRLVEVGGTTPEFHLILGKAYLNREEPEKAITELERAESANPDMPFLHFGLGIAYMRIDDNERAETEFRKEIALAPDSPDIYEQLGEFYLKVGKDEEARSEFDGGTAAQSENAGVTLWACQDLFAARKIPAGSDGDRCGRTSGAGQQQCAFHARTNSDEAGEARGGGKRVAHREEADDASTDKDKEPGSMNENRVRNPELAQPPQ